MLVFVIKIVTDEICPKGLLVDIVKIILYDISKDFFYIISKEPLSCHLIATYEISNW